MNRGIAILLLFVIFGAMGLVMYSQNKNRHSGAQPDSAPLVSAPVDKGGQMTGYVPVPTPMVAPQGGGGPHPIENAQGNDGVPTPVILSTGSDPRPVRVITPDDESGLSAKPQTTQPDSKTATPDSLAPDSAPPPSGSALTSQDRTTAESSPAKGSAPSLTADNTPWDKPAQKPVKADPQRKRAPTNQSASNGADAAQAKTSPSTASGQAGSESGGQSGDEKALDKTGRHNMTLIKLSFAENQIYLRIEAEDAFPVKTFTLTNPDRLVVDLPGTWKGVTAPSVPSNNVVGGVRLGQQPAGPRLVLDLKRPLENYTTERTGGRVDILMQ